MTGLELPVTTIVLLMLASLVAGWVDSIVGGGGLIQLPALLLGLPADTPVATIAGTNKVPSSLGTAAASITYLRQVPVALLGVLPLVLGAAAGSAGGAQLTHLVDRRAFNPLVLAAIIGVGWYTWRRPALGLKQTAHYRGAAAAIRLLVIGAVVGAWDGVVGPGTGSFFLILLVSIMGLDFLRATALAKVANLTTNMAAIVVFGISGSILWGLALAMGATNLAGALIGSRMALRNGNAFVRRVFLVVIVALGAKLAWDTVATFLPVP